MSVFLETETIERALNLPESARARLVGRLLASLRPVLDDDDGGVAEAIRRDREMDEHPEKIITLDQLDELIANRPRREKR